MQISGRTFLVTGGGNGIGREVVLGLLARGACVAAIDLHEGDLSETAAAAGSGACRRLSRHVVSVTDRQGIEALVGHVKARHTHIDGVVNVAGVIQRFVPVVDLTQEDMAAVMDVNFWGVVNVTMAVLPELLTRPQACVVNVSSMGALVPVPGQTVYGASKAAVKLFTEGLYAELLGSAVAVTVVFPGAVHTDISRNSGVDLGAGAQEGAAHIPMTEPAEAARAIIEALVQGKYRVTIGKDAAGLDALVRIAPQRAVETVAKRMKQLVG